MKNKMLVRSLFATLAGATLLITLLLTPNQAHSQGGASAYTPEGHITRLEEYGVGYFVFGMNLINPSGCDRGDKVLPDSALSPEQIDRLNKTLLAAHLAGRPVRLKIRGGTACQEDRPVYYAVQVF